MIFYGSGATGLTAWNALALSNTGTILGGDGAAARSSFGSAMDGAGGGTGAVVGWDGGSGTFSNGGSIAGGAGGYAGYQGGTGGTGLDLFGGTLINPGSLAGGAGGGTGRYGGTGGRGGTCVSLTDAVLVNQGSIDGGAGGYGERYFGLGFGGTGGTGISLYDSILTNAGTIAGGAGGAGYTAAGSFGTAIDFTGAGMLAVDPGAVFIGLVAADAAATDALDFAGSGAGTLSGIGTQFTGFSSFAFASGAQWRVEGSASAFSTGQTITGFDTGDALVLDGFAANSQTYVAGTGLELTAGTTEIVLDITEVTGANGFIVTEGSGNTTITVGSPLIGTISTLYARAITLGEGGFAGALTVTSTGTVQSGFYAAPSVEVPTADAGAALINAGAILGAADPGGEIGGQAVVLSAGTDLASGGRIVGGAGANGGTATNIADSGGVAIIATAASEIANSGLIDGGRGGNNTAGGPGGPGGIGAHGVLLEVGGCTVSNSGTIAGGAGGTGGKSGPDSRPGYGGFGGWGVLAGLGAIISNDGLILGGAGGSDAKADGGTGGVGLGLFDEPFSPQSPSVAVNVGRIAGGAGGAGLLGGNGGAGVYLQTGTLTNFGRIAGGAAGRGTSANGTMGDAVQFGSGTGTLVIEPGAVFSGAVAGDPLANDTLELAGSSGGGLSSAFGSQFTGFSSLIEDAGAHWTLKSATAAEALVTVAGALVLSAGSLTGTVLDVLAGGAVSGKGMLGGAVANAGSVTASGGTLVLAGALSGAGALCAANGSTLADAGGGTLGGSVSGAGTLLLEGSATLATNIGIGHLALSQGASLMGAGTVTSAVSNGGVIGTNGGALFFLGAFSNSGTANAAGGLLSIKDDVGGSGTLAIGNAGTLALLDGAGAGQVLDFSSPDALAELTRPANFLGLIENFVSGDTIELVGTAASSLSYSPGTLSVKNGTHVVARLQFSGSYTNTSFNLTHDAQGDSFIGHN